MPTASALAILASAKLPGAHRARRSQGGIAWEVASGLIGRWRWPVVRIAGARAERGHRAQTRRMCPRRRCGGARLRSTTGSRSGPPERGPSAFRGPFGLDGRVWDQRRHSQTVAQLRVSVTTPAGVSSLTPAPRCAPQRAFAAVALSSSAAQRSNFSASRCSTSSARWRSRFATSGPCRW